ncbi:MAG: superoxide dismutase family protein [Lachnospiraceae bacterium]|nr:superoxide dismutase family protein [Lachnospiraceae bacterium]
MPAAYAELTGNPGNSEITGIVRFYPVNGGVLVNAEIYGLPTSAESCRSDIFGFHIHEGNSCTGTESDPYANTGGHYNPSDCPHPAHMGDMPPLFGNNGSAWMMYFTDRFTILDLIGKTIIIHSSPDDFTTQPSGNSGAKIACGTIVSVT